MLREYGKTSQEIFLSISNLRRSWGRLSFKDRGYTRSKPKSGIQPPQLRLIFLHWPPTKTLRPPKARNVGKFQSARKGVFRSRRKTMKLRHR
jgi:hypothetical protein